MNKTNDGPTVERQTQRACLDCGRLSTHTYFSNKVLAVDDGCTCERQAVAMLFPHHPEYAGWADITLGAISVETRYYYLGNEKTSIKE